MPKKKLSEKLSEKYTREDVEKLVPTAPSFPSGGNVKAYTNTLLKEKRISKFIGQEKDEKSDKLLKNLVFGYFNDSTITALKGAKIDQGVIREYAKQQAKSKTLGDKGLQEFLAYLLDKDFLKEQEWESLPDNELNRGILTQQMGDIMSEWKDNIYLPERTKRRLELLEVAKIPTKCSFLPGPKINMKTKKSKGTTLAVLEALKDYCDKFVETREKNIAEQAFAKAVVEPMSDYCVKSIDNYSKVRGKLFRRKEADKVKSEIINELIRGNKYNIRVAFAQVSTRLVLLSKSVNKAHKEFQKSNDLEKLNSTLNNIYKEIETMYGRDVVAKEDFIGEKHVEFRRAAKILADRVQVWARDFEELARLLEAAQKR